MKLIPIFLAGRQNSSSSSGGKSTIINLHGYDFTYNYAIKLKKNILRKLKKHGSKANDLINLINFILERKY